MKSLNTQCIILGHKNLKEQDKLIFLYSEDLGKIKAIAKGAQKITSKFVGHLETLNICTISLYLAPNNIIITEVSTDENFRKTRENLEALSAALLIAEITNTILQEHQTLDNLLKLIKKTISHLSNSKKPKLIAIAYIIKFLDKSGLLPDYKNSEIPIAKKYLKFLNFLKENTLTEIEKIVLTKEEKTQIHHYLQSVLEEITDKSIKSLNLL